MSRSVRFPAGLWEKSYPAWNIISSHYQCGKAVKPERSKYEHRDAAGDKRRNRRFPGMETAAQTVNFIIKSEKIPGKDNAFDQKEIQCNITDGKVIVPTDKLPAAELDLYIKLDDLTISNTKTISLKPKINLEFCDRNDPYPATEYMQIGIAVSFAEDYHISSNGNVTVCTPYGEIDGKLYAGSNKSGTLRFLLDEQHFPANKTVELYVTDGIYSSNLSYLKVSQ